MPTKGKAKKVRRAKTSPIWEAEEIKPTKGKSKKGGRINTQARISGKLNTLRSMGKKKTK